MSTKETGFAGRLQEARAGSGLSLTQLAAEVGVTEAAVRMWENGQREPNSRYLPGIAKATGKPIAWFFEEVPA